MKYFFGKVTMYTSYNVDARNALLYFMNSYFPDNEKLVNPIHPINIEGDLSIRKFDGNPLWVGEGKLIIA